MKQRDNAKWYHIVYEYIGGDWNFWTDFHELSSHIFKKNDPGVHISHFADSFQFFW